MSQTFGQHVATVSSSNMPLLGHLCWYSIPEETVEHGAVLQLCKDNDLESYAPAPPRPPDVFRRACKESKRRIGGKEAPQRFSYEFKPIDHDNDEILMKLVREEVDAATNKGIDWKRMANVTFKRDTHRIDVIELPELDDVGREVLQHARSMFRAENGKVNSAHIRRMIGSVLDNCMATAVRPSGGIYFVTQTQAPKLEKLAKVINGLPTGASMHPVPLVDTTDQRQMLQAAVEAELAGEIDSQLAKIDEFLKGGDRLTADQFTRLTADLHRSGRKGNEYAKLLQQKLGVFDVRKAMASDAIRKLADRVEVS